MKVHKELAKNIVWVCTQAVILILTCVFICAVPVGLTLLSPIYFFRFAVSKLAKICRPDLGKMLCTRSTLTGVDDIYTKPKAILTVTISVKDFLQIEDVRRIFTNNVLERKDANGEYKYVELRHSIAYWSGFLFWKPEENFNPSDHIHYFDSDPKFPKYDENGKEIPFFPRKRTVADLADVENELTVRPFPPGTSPWDLLIVPHYCPNEENPDEEHTAIILRIHHSVADGYSILKLILAGIANNESYLNSVSKPTFKRRSGWEKFMDVLRFILYAPYEQAQLVIQSKDHNEWRLPEKKLTGKYSSAFSPQIPMDYIKEIRRMHKVCLSSVMIAAWTAGVRKAMLHRGIKVPDYAHSFTPLPMPGHPDKLRNYMYN